MPLVAAWPAEQPTPLAAQRDNFLPLEQDCAPLASLSASPSTWRRRFAAKLLEPTPCGRAHGTSRATRKHEISRCARSDSGYPRFLCWGDSSSVRRVLRTLAASSSLGLIPTSRAPRACRPFLS